MVVDGTDWTNDEYSKTCAITKVYSEPRRSVRVTPWPMRGKGRVPSEAETS